MWVVYLVIILVIFSCTSLQQLHCRLVWFLFAANWITHSFQCVSLPETITRRFHYTPFPVLLVLPMHSFLYTRIQPRTVGIIFTRRFHYTRFPLLTHSPFPLRLTHETKLRCEFAKKLILPVIEPPFTIFLLEDRISLSN